MLWIICKKADMLWVKWIHTYVIKDACFWTMKIPQNATWTVQKLLQLRSVVLPWITYVRVMVMDHGTFLWWDNWHPVGPLYLRYRDSFERNPIRAMNVKVSSIIANGCWNWPQLRNFVTQDIISHTPVMFLPHMGCK